MRRLLGIALSIALASSLAADPAPRVSYQRTIPAVRALGGDDIVVIYAFGPQDPMAVFLDTFLERVNRSGDLRVDLVGRKQLFLGRKPDDAAMRRIRRVFPRDVYVGIGELQCHTVVREGEGSTYNSSGDRIRRHHYWSDSTCDVRLDVADPLTGAPRSSIRASGDGTSARVDRISAEERITGENQAAHMAAVRLAELITPRHVRESIELDPSVPDFDRAIEFIDAGRLAAARWLLESAMRSKATAALHYDIAAISEAMGALSDADVHYGLAHALAPNDARYARQQLRFRRRTGWQPANENEKGRHAAGPSKKQ